MEDFLGQTYEEGDVIIYAAMSGRCITMVMARVLTIREGSVTVDPMKSSRWKQHHGRTRYIDTRTGKGVDPCRSDKHVKKQPHFRDIRNGTEVDLNDGYEYIRKTYGYNGWNKYEYLDYVGIEFNDYIKQETVKSKVVLTVTDNIVKWNGELPDDFK